MSDRFLVIGISDGTDPVFEPSLVRRIAAAPVVSGGVRHHAIVSSLLSPDVCWIDITVPLENVFSRYRDIDGEIIVFASGDPLFYGFAATLKNHVPDASIEVIPAFNSLQMLAHRLAEPYGNMICVSLTGRPWRGFYAALISQPPLMGVLTDRRHTPGAIARQMLRFGYDNYLMAVGERLGNRDERVAWYQLSEAVDREFEMPCSVMLRRTHNRNLPFGIPDRLFVHLDGRPGMMTKMPIRLLSISMLGLEHRTELWDIGFCTGSISIEARLRFPMLGITAFERRKECHAILEENCRRFGAPGIEDVIGDFMECDLSAFPCPDAVFIGGHGGRLREMLARITGVMLPGCCIVFNSVSAQSREDFAGACAALGLRITTTHTVSLDSYNPVTIMRAER